MNIINIEGIILLREIILANFCLFKEILILQKENHIFFSKSKAVI